MSLENQHKNFDTFKKYYTGKMSPEEKSNFESELENDPFAKDAYEGFLVFENDFKRISAIENTNMSFKDKYSLNEGGASSFPIKTVMGIAASIVLLVGGFFMVQNSFSNANGNLAENKVEEVVPEEENVEVEQESIPIDYDSVENKLQNGWDNEAFDDVISSNEVLIEQSEVAEEKLSITDIKKDDSPKFTSEPNRKNEKKQIGAAEYNEYHQNQKESQAGEQGTVTYDITTNASSENKDKVAPSPAMFNTVAIEEDMLEEEVSSVSSYKSGIVAYNQSNYTQAIQYFDSSISKKKNINSSNYYIGMSYFNQNKANKAINYFDKVINTPSSFSDDAQWYKAISLINKGQKEKAKTLLIDIINSNSGYSSAAQKKLNSLN